MRALFAFSAILLTIAPASAGPKRQTLQLPRIVGGAELKDLISGSYIWEDRERGPDDHMSEYFLRDGSYRENDGANEADMGQYSFAGNTFCVRSWEHKADLCRSVLIDSRNRKWLITDSEKLRATLVIIQPIESRR